MEKFARKCDVTHDLMNQGWVVRDGEMYIKNERDALNKAVEMGYKSIEDAYDNGEMFWTDWEGDYWYAIDEDGNIICIKNPAEPHELNELKEFLLQLKKSASQMLYKLDSDVVKDDEFWNKYSYTISTNGKSITLPINADTYDNFENFLQNLIDNYEL